MAIATLDPTTGVLSQEFNPLTDQEITSKLLLAQETWQNYQQIPLTQRSQWLISAAEILERDRYHWAKLMTLEMGKPLKAAIAEVEKCALVCRYYAENAPQFLADVPVQTDAKHSFIRYQPLGIILAVMPWNFPFWQVFRFAAPALMAGNGGVLKHASNVPQCALAIEEILLKAGFPPGIFQTFLIGSDAVSHLIADERIKAATLTGSEFAGSSLASLAGKYIKKMVLELGGSDPFIVLESADLDKAVSTAVTARMLNNGQSCIAAKRFIVQETIADEFQRKFVEKFAALKVGDPKDESTEVGPLATRGILEDLDQQVQKSVEMGAKVLIGGHPETFKQTLDPSLQNGNFYPPTILTEIPPGSPAAQEEFFGPVALLFRVKNLDEAIQLANSTCFGLGTSAWTKDPQQCDRLTQEIAAGSVFINSLVKSDPRLPFGGIKNSGYGRELGIQGIHEFVNIKTVWIDD